MKSHLDLPFDVLDNGVSSSIVTLISLPPKRILEAPHRENNKLKQVYLLAMTCISARKQSHFGSSLLEPMTIGDSSMASPLA